MPDGTDTTTQQGDQGANAGAPDAAAKAAAEATKAAEAKAAAGKSAPGADSPIELKLPEGFTANEKQLGEFKAIAKELGLNSTKAQRVFDVYAKSAIDREAEVDKEISGWSAASKADKEYGGKDFEASRALANKALAKFGTKALDQFLTDYRLGDHPEVIRLLVRVGKALGEDTVEGTNGTAGKTPQGDDKAFYAALYPTMKDQVR